MDRQWRRRFLRWWGIYLAVHLVVTLAVVGSYGLWRGWDSVTWQVVVLLPFWFEWIPALALSRLL